MKNISLTKTLFAIVAMFVSFSAFSQTAEQQQTKRGPYITNGFWDNWFISAGVGVQDYIGEYFRKGGSMKQVTPAFDLSVGKWITPIFGARFQLAGLSAKSYTMDASNPFVDGTSNGYYVLKMNYLHYHVDFMLNLSAAIGGYKENRVYEFIPYVGFGGISATNHTSNKLAFNAGLFNKFRVSKAIDINIDIKGALFNQSFDYQTGGRKGEGIASVTAGITYHFPNRTFKRASELEKEDLTPFNNRIKGLEDELSGANAKNKALADALAAEKNKPAQVSTESTPIAPLATFFPIGKTALTTKEKVNLDAVAKIIKANPDKKYVVKGYADKQTGSATRNMQLSKQRAQNVANYLVSQGVNKSQLEVQGLGSTVSPYASATLNRVAVVEE